MTTSLADIRRLERRMRWLSSHRVGLTLVIGALVGLAFTVRRDAFVGGALAIAFGLLAHHACDFVLAVWSHRLDVYRDRLIPRALAHVIRNDKSPRPATRALP